MRGVNSSMSVDSAFDAYGLGGPAKSNGSRTPGSDRRLGQRRLKRWPLVFFVRTDALLRGVAPALTRIIARAIVTS